jgi:hypothetical protein
MRKNRGFNVSPWKDKQKGYVLRSAPTPTYPLGKILDVSKNKDYIFSLLKHFESKGTVCWVEDERGERIS